MEERESSARAIRRAIDREVELVSSAIDLVATGGAESTMVLGLRLTDSVIEIVQPRAASRGVIVEPLWGPDETVNDVRVRRETAS